MKLILLTVILIVVTVPAGAVSGVNQAAAAPPRQALRTCQNIQLLIQARGSQGAAGHIAVNYRIHNMTSQACTLYGYPGVQLLNRQFLTLPTTVRRGGFLGTIPVRTIRVAGHGNAYFTLGYSDVQTDGQPCYTAVYLMIFAPNNFLPVVTYAVPRQGGSIYACSGALDVTPVTAQPRY